MFDQIENARSKLDANPHGMVSATRVFNLIEVIPLEYHFSETRQERLSEI